MTHVVAPTSGGAEDPRTWPWQRPTRDAVDADLAERLREGIAAVCRDPDHDEPRRRLRALASERGAGAQLATLLGHEAKRAARPAVAAALHEELADVRENLEQPLEAISAMEVVVALQPDEARHHDRLAWLYRRAGAILEAARAFERVAALATDDRARAALRAAGRLYRDAGERERAVTTYRAIVERRATDLEAWRALDELLTELGRVRELVDVRAALDRLLATGPDRAHAVRVQIESARRARAAGALADAVAHYERARALVGPRAPNDLLDDELAETRTELAVEQASARARTGDCAQGERALRAILAGQPLHVTANLALADLLSATGRLPAAAHHLRGTLAAAPADAPSEVRARLTLRCARATLALGDPDEAHRLLLEAHRLARRDLEVTLALGESCFSRKLWRETALYLGALADHPDAGAHPARVALALVRAGQAEVRALRPGNAPRHYEAAVRVDPTCAAAWRQLAELARDRGDLARAADCLEREAEATSEASARVRLFDALAELALGPLADPARAERCWASVTADGGAPVLRKLLAVQRRRGATSERAATCQQLAALEPDPAVARPLLVEAARLLASAGDHARARLLAGQLAADHPLDADALCCATEIAAGEHDVVATWLRRALGSVDATRARGASDPRLAELWRRLGDAERHRGNDRAALDAYQRAIPCAPESDGARRARRGLIDLAASAGHRADTSRHALVEAEQEPADMLALARELARSAAPTARDDARQLFELACALGATLAGDDERILAQHPARVMASDEAYAASLPEAARRRLVDDDHDAPLADVLALVAEALPMVCGDARSALEAAGLSGARRLSAASGSASVAMFPQIANALGGSPTLLHAAPAHAAPDLRVLAAAPPVVVFGPRLAAARARTRDDHANTRDDERRHARELDAELRFALGRIVELARPHRALAVGVERGRFERFLAGLIHAVVPGRQGIAAREVAAEAERLRGALPRALRGRIAERLAGAGPGALDAERYLAACGRAADRAGLVACGHPGVALRLAGGPARARHLVELAASQRYLASQRTLRRRAR